MDRIRRHLARYGEWWWVPLLYTLAVIWIYRDLWHQKGIATGFGWDVIDTHGPDLDWFSRELREDRFSLWNPYDKGGYPVFADPIVDRYYPANWPFAWFGALFGTGFWLVQIKVLFHHVIGASMLHAFLRRRGISRGGAMIAGLGLIASTPLLVHKGSNILWPMVWVPLIWMAIDAAIAKPSWRRGAALGAALLLAETAGSPPGLFYTLMLVGPYGLWRIATNRRWSWQLLGCFAVAGVVALAPLLLVVLPQRQLVALGSRERWAKGDDFALSLSAPWREVWRGAVTHGAGIQEMYMGSVVVLLAACSLLARGMHDRAIAWCWLLCATLGVMLAMGATGEILPWFVHHVPGFALLRIPGRYKLVSIWALCAMAGYGADAVGSRWRTLVCAAGMIAFVAWLVHKHGIPGVREAWWSTAAMAIAAVLVALATLARVRGIALAALALAALFDCPTFSFSAEAPPVSDQRRLHQQDEHLVARLEGARDRWRIYDEFLLGERAGARLQLRDFRGYPSVDPLSQQRYVDVLEMARTEPEILADFNVRWVTTSSHFRFAGSANFVHLPHPGFTDRGGGVWEAVDPAPLVMWYGNATIERDPARVLEDVRAAAHTRAVLELAEARRLPYDLPLREPASVAGTLVAYAPDEIRAIVDAPREGLVVLDELYYPGWTIEVDGVAAPMLRANYLMRGVWVGAGHHAITWRFEPREFRPLFAGYLFALLLIASAAIAAYQRRRY